MHPAIATVRVAANFGIAAAGDRAHSARLDSVIDRAISEKRIVGTVVLVAKDGKVVYRRAAGLADREAGRPMREDALFRLASLTKMSVPLSYAPGTRWGYSMATDVLGEVIARAGGPRCPRWSSGSSPAHSAWRTRPSA